MHFRGGGVGHTTRFNVAAANYVSPDLFRIVGFDPRGIRGGKLAADQRIFDQHDADDGVEEYCARAAHFDDSDRESAIEFVDADVSDDSDTDVDDDVDDDDDDDDEPSTISE